jgi:hypothetical protein
MRATVGGTGLHEAVGNLITVIRLLNDRVGDNAPVSKEYTSNSRRRQIQTTIINMRSQLNEIEHQLADVDTGLLYKLAHEMNFIDNQLDQVRTAL